MDDCETCEKAIGERDEAWADLEEQQETVKRLLDDLAAERRKNVELVKTGLRFEGALMAIRELGLGLRGN